MKKTRFLVLALVVAVMLMGAGYAWWNDTITVSSTVHTGTLDVDITGTDVLTYDSGVVLALTELKSGNDCDDEDSAKFSFTNLYPDAGATAKLTFTNNGSIPVKLDKKVSFSIDPIGDNGTPKWSDDKFIAIEYTAKLADNTLKTIVFEDYGNHTFSYTGDPITIAPGLSAEFALKVKLPAGLAMGYDNTNQNEGDLYFTIRPNFIQTNDLR